MTADGSSATAAAASLASHLVATAAALAAGVVLGGWIAFETGRWETFRRWIEGLGDGAVVLAAGLLALAAAASLAATYVRARETPDGRARGGE